jgi:hypothetical protein
MQFGCFLDHCQNSRPDSRILDVPSLNLAPNSWSDHKIYLYVNGCIPYGAYNLYIICVDIYCRRSYGASFCEYKIY